LSPGSDISPAQAANLLDDLTAIVARASALIRAKASADIESRAKPDGSPVTAADEASEAEILRGLAKLLPGVAVVSEEMAGKAAPPALGKSFIVVDPLDGTREFLAGSDQFTVNLAIVTGGMPVVGIIAAPNHRQVWRGIVGAKAERLRLLADGADQPQEIHTRRWPAQGAVAAMSRSHLDPATESFLTRLEPIARRQSGSAIKFCQIADGAVDVYPRLATTCEWDVAAGHALVAAAGGIVTKPGGESLSFGHADKNFRVPSFIAWGDPAKAASFTA
jgi:3'(2'), 5'-bisphosphate nucleotidase